MEVENEGEGGVCTNRGAEKSELLALMQRTPGEAHPNLLAHLKSPAKIPTQPPATAPTSASASAVTYPWITVHGPHLRKIVKEPSPEAMTSSSAYQKQNAGHMSLGQDQTAIRHGHPGGQFVGQGQVSRQMSLGQGHAGAQMGHPTGQMSLGHGQMLMGQGQMPLGQGQMDMKQTTTAGAGFASKEQFHAVAVQQLKGKLQRKFDSMENLQKIGKESPPQQQQQPDVGRAPENGGIPKTCPFSGAMQQQQQQQPDVGRAPDNGSIPKTCPFSGPVQQQQQQQQNSLTKSVLEQSIESSFASQGFPASMFHSILASCPVSHGGPMSMPSAVTTATYSPQSMTTSSKQNMQTSSPTESQSQSDVPQQKGIEQHHPLNLSTSKVEESHVTGHALNSVPTATTDTTVTSPNGFAASVITSSNQTAS